MTQDSSGESGIDSLPGVPQLPESDKTEYFHDPPYCELNEAEFANKPATVGAMDHRERPEPDDIVQLGQFSPAYLRQWAQLIDFAYGSYDINGQPSGSVSLELRKRDQTWILTAMPEHGDDDGIRPVVMNRHYTDGIVGERTALPKDGDSDE
ncbi:hypothetical protein DP107_04365 [Haloglomus irregulare]|jgi:hypothetical protein|uniref:Uncharacterized protein n=1 Tax=Haloglomus irregulare TaxID=2234134 RepID=A0A554NCJ8_9EURY|nr:hypothetical protein [Haloglomus irregulare]TSD15094.1 hypothetical protein DP107_04365 [Haloglomus irregulare]